MRWRRSHQQKASWRPLATRTYQFAAGYCCANATSNAYPLTSLRAALHEQPLFRPGAITRWEQWPGGILAVLAAVTVPLDVDERDAGGLLAEAIHAVDDGQLEWLVPSRDAQLAKGYPAAVARALGLEAPDA